MRLLAAIALLFVGFAQAWQHWYADGEFQVEADGTILVRAPASGEQAGAFRLPDMEDKSGHVLSVSVMAEQWRAVETAQVILSTSGFFEQYVSVDLPELLVEPADSMWLDVAVPTGSWFATAEADWRTVNGMVVRVVSKPGSRAVVGFRDITFTPARAHAGVISLAFDDGWADVADVAFPLMEQYGFTGTVYAIPELVGVSRWGLRYMNQQELYELQQAGWEIGAHGEFPLTDLEMSEVTQHLSYSSQWLAASGFTDKGSYAYANGMYDAQILEHVAELFETGRTINPRADTLGFASRLQLSALSVYPDLAQTDIEQMVRRAVADGGWLIIAFHQLKEVSEYDTQFPIGRFEDLLQFLARERVQVMTVAEAWNHNLHIARCGSAPHPQFTC